ncbi:MAG: hypothetical protein ABL999_07375 [Pyrinomonadaceae bacterium]
MAHNWIELGEGPKKAWRGEIYASMNYRSEIVINRRAFEALDKPEAVVMLFDEDESTIGLRPASVATVNAYRLKPKGSSGHRVVNARALARKHDIRIDGTDRFRTAAVEDGVLVLDLRNRVCVNALKRGPYKKNGKDQSTVSRKL